MNNTQKPSDSIGIEPTTRAEEKILEGLATAMDRIFGRPRDEEEDEPYVPTASERRGDLEDLGHEECAQREADFRAGLGEAL